MMMDLIKTAEDLVRFRTETGNAAEIEKCLDYIKASFEGTSALVKIERFENVSPVIYIANNNEMQQDALVLGHIDVVKAKDTMFEPKIEGDRMFGRGTLDMKSFAAVAMHTMNYVLEKKLPIRFAIALSTDEETGSESTQAFLRRYAVLNAGVVLDNDVGGDITKIINKCKNPVYVRLKAKGKSAHGSTPWEGLDANEILMQTIANLRRYYPYYDLKSGAPENTWIDTMHVAKICGGEVDNIIAGQAEAHLDCRLIETSTLESLINNLKAACVDGVSFEIVSSSVPVVMAEDNPQIAAYKELAEKVIGEKITFEQIGGATDSREFAERGATVIMHSGTGEGMHADNEYVVLSSVKKLAELQIAYLEKLAAEKHG